MKKDKIKQKFDMKLSRRQILKAGLYGGAGLMLPWRFMLARANAATLGLNLSDPAIQPKFEELAPNALDPGFLYKDFGGTPSAKPNFRIKASKTKQQTGLINPSNGKKLTTDLWGYGQNTVSWPGQTIQVMSTSAGGAAETVVRWDNKIRDKAHLLPVDTSLHWCYSLPGYTQYSIRNDGVPIVTHLHGGNSDFQYDGNPEFFYTPNEKITGPQWDNVPGGFTNTFRYNNDVPAGNLWYHDHALGITRLNVYAGLAGFYFVRDDMDTGLPGNPLDLPAFPYELAYAVQDRMFTNQGALFYPAFPDDPAWADFITMEGVAVCPEVPTLPAQDCVTPPSALAEFFGDHIVVNGKIWPKTNVEPRHYRMRLLNGCDSRFLVIQFRRVPAGATNLRDAGAPIAFDVIGSDQGLGTPATTDTLVFENGGRYDIVFDFSGFDETDRIIMVNQGWDVPFGGDFGRDDAGPDDLFPESQTDRIMAFDVVVPYDVNVPDYYSSTDITYSGVPGPATRRKVALFEGRDEFGRLQPLLGTFEGGKWVAIPWHLPTTETPTVDTNEIWEIYNFTGDAHPVHLHLVNFQILGRAEISFDEDGLQRVLQHNGKWGWVTTPENVLIGNRLTLGPGDGYYETAPKDMVTALPETVTTIKAHFNKTGRYVWHCHILSHEDHEMMRVLQVG